MCEKIRNKVNIGLTALFVVLFWVPSFGVVTAYNNYHYATSPWLYQTDPGLAYTEMPSGSFSLVIPASFPAGDPNFGTALDVNDACVYFRDILDPPATDYNEGTVEMWIAPHWNGANQGGVGVGAAIGSQQNLLVTGQNEHTQGPVNIFIENQYGDGGDLWATFNMGVENITLNSNPVGSTADWTAGSWHHVAVSWDATMVGLYLDNMIIDEVARTSSNPVNFADHGYLFANDSRSGPVNAWDGMVDDLVISSHAKYTPGAGGYTMPTAPAIPPKSAQEVWDLGFGMDRDFYQDCYINFFDFAVLANNDSNFVDLALFVNDWLRSNHPDNPDGEKPWMLSFIPPGCPIYTGNLLQNPSFEYSSDSVAAFWSKDISGMIGTYDFYISDNAHTGQKSLAIESLIGGMARWYTSDIHLVNNVEYRVSCWVKTEGTGTKIGTVWLPSVGISLSFGETPAWTRLESDFVATFTGIETIFLMSQGVGTLLFDDVSIEMLSTPLQNTKNEIPTNGEPLTRIVIPDDCNLTYYHSAFEVRRVLDEMTGIELPVVVKSMTLPAETGCIYIGCAPGINDYTADLASVGYEGIVLDIKTDNIVCLGNTIRGVYYSAQEFLYQLGCRWYTPWDGGECIPTTPTLTLPYQKIVHEPSFKLRGNIIIHHYHYPPDMVSSWVNIFDWWEWEARNRMNGFKTDTTFCDPGYIYGNGALDLAGHSIHAVVDPSVYFASHPEYFPLVDGGRTYTTPWGNRPANVCVSNTDVIQICADYVNDYFEAYPDADRVHIGQMDVGAHCECIHCVALDPPGSVDWSKKTTHVLVFTDRWLWFINQIADIVKLSHPDKFVGTYSYAETHTTPIYPSNNPRDNVLIELTWSFTNLQDNSAWRPVRCFKHDMNDLSCSYNTEGMQILNNWAALAPISIYSYYSHYNNRGTAGAYCHHDANFYRSLYNAGVRHINDEVGADALCAPLLLNLRKRLLWDINTDVNQYIDDFCNIVYGPAAVPVKQYFTAVEEAIGNSANAHVNYSDFSIFTPAILSSLDGYINNALSAAGSNTTLLARIARLRISLIYTELIVGYGNASSLKNEANSLVQIYNIPVMYTVWDVLAP